MKTLKNLINTDIDWVKVVESYGLKIIQLSTFRYGYIQLKIGESCTPDCPIFENFWYILSDEELNNLQYSKEKPDCVNYDSVIENRVDIWWRKFEADFKTKLYMNK